MSGLTALRGAGEGPIFAGEAEPARALASAGRSTARVAFADLLRGLGHAIGSGEGAMRAALTSMQSGADLAPQGLLALQAGVYRYSEAIDLASRLVEHATSGVKTVLQGAGE